VLPTRLYEIEPETMKVELRQILDAIGVIFKEGGRK
jgi:hypothetical protein